ncbi:hypothetical protein INR49_030800 [Caranx melampygus]|nr:hypothetical protein INR49_030800 [Caranx melampygus]
MADNDVDIATPPPTAYLSKWTDPALRNCHSRIQQPQYKDERMAGWAWGSEDTSEDPCLTHN